MFVPFGNIRGRHICIFSLRTLRCPANRQPDKPRLCANSSFQYFRNSELGRRWRYSKFDSPLSCWLIPYLGCCAAYHREATVMATMFGRFEIQSELSKSDTALIYKATDTETNQVVALKTQSLEPLGERSEAFVETLIAEGENTRNLAGQNIVLLYGAGEMDGQFCAAMEYIQGNSVATMLARKEGFSIWDLLDIGRQVCSGLDHAHSHNIFHHSLEPSKIMCGWDGMVRILGYGLSSVGKFTLQMEGVPSILHYMSPEQIRGENIDARSNFFSLGAMFYEMVADRKAFDREDAESLRQSILESTPVSP